MRPHVLDLPCLLVHIVGALQTEVHLWVLAQMHHPIGGIDGAAAPALNAPVIVQVDGGDDGLGAHGFQSAGPHHLLEGLAVHTLSSACG